MIGVYYLLLRTVLETVLKAVLKPVGALPLGKNPSLNILEWLKFEDWRRPPKVVI